jgi:hypothetical protein
MAFIPCYQTCQVELRYSCFGQDVENTLYFRREAGLEETHVHAIVNGITDWWYERMRQYHHSSLTMREVYGRDMSTQEGYHYANTDYFGYAGTRTSGYCSPLNVAFSISFRSGYVGRTMRGRNYVTAISTADITGNSVTTAYANNIKAAYEYLLTPGTYYPSACYWAVCSRYFNGAPRLAGHVTPIISVVVVDEYVDSQRGRLTGRGD